jgi:hypothetical protein
LEQIENNPIFNIAMVYLIGSLFCHGDYMQRSSHQRQPLQNLNFLPLVCYCKDEEFEILWPNLVTSSKGGTENEKCLSRKKKMYSESEIMLTDINGPMTI